MRDASKSFQVAFGGHRIPAVHYVKPLTRANILHTIAREHS